MLNKLISASLPFIPKPIVRMVANRYIAGEHLDEAVTTVRKLNREGASATLDVLGEFVTTRDATLHMRDACIATLDRIAEHKLDCNLSIKLTSVGMGLDDALCEKNIGEILERAKRHSIFVRFDMEDSPYTSRTLDLYARLRKTYNIGVVVQAYLRRTSADVKRLTDEAPSRFRLCKGIYIEPEDIAYKEREEVCTNYKRLLCQMFEARAHVAIATHDEPLIEFASREVKRRGLTPGEHYEFQMLLGVRDERRRALVKEGHKVRVYVPFGEDWYGYSIRRLKENPQVAGYVFKAMLGLGK